MTAPIYRGELPYLTTEQMIEVDRAMIEDFGIELVQMMENAGRALAHLARERFLGGDPLGKRSPSWPARAATAAVRWSARGGCTTGARGSGSSSPNPTKASPRSPPINSASFAGCA